MGGGGYNPGSVSRSWMTILAELSGFQLPEESPSEWLQWMKDELGIIASPTIFDEPSTEEAAQRPDFVRAANQQYSDALREELSPYHKLGTD